MQHYYFCFMYLMYDFTYFVVCFIHFLALCLLETSSCLHVIKFRNFTLIVLTSINLVTFACTYHRILEAMYALDNLFHIFDGY